MILNSIFFAFIIAKVNGVKHGAGSYHAGDSGRCKWSGPMIGSIPSNNIGCYNDKTIESCKAMCNDEPNCKSIDYKYDGRCCLGKCRIGSECSNDNHPDWIYYACLDIDIPANKGNLPFITQTDYGSAPTTSEPCPIGYTLQWPGYPQGECQQNDRNDGETYAGKMTLFECATECDADSKCVTFDYLNERCYLNEYCDKRDNDNYLACRKIDYNDFSSKAAMEANGWQFTPNSAHMFIDHYSDSDDRATFCPWNGPTSYCGFDLVGAGSTSVIMRSSGTVKITYGGSFQHVDNYVKLEVNGVEKSRVKGKGKGYTIIRVMKDDRVSFTEVGISVINIHEFKFEPAPFEGVVKNCDWNMERFGPVEGNNLHCWDSGISNSTCMERCDQHEDCKAISWKKMSNPDVEPQTGECCLEYIRRGDGSYGSTTAYNPNDFDYKYWSCKDPYERCDWSMAVMGAINGHNLGCYDGKTPAQCKQLCEFTENCKSIDHQFDGRCCLNDCDIESGCALTDSDEHMYYTCDSRSTLNTAEDFYWGFLSYDQSLNGVVCSERANEGDLAGICCTPMTHSGVHGIGWPGKKYFSWDCLTEDELVDAGWSEQDFQKHGYVKSNHQAQRRTHIKKVCPDACEEATTDLVMSLYGR